MVNNMTDLTAQEPAWQTRDHLDDPVIGELRNRFGPDAFTVQATRTGVPVVWIKREQLLEVGDFLKKLPKPYVMLFDFRLTSITPDHNLLCQATAVRAEHRV